jgi:hypothetical protein
MNMFRSTWSRCLLDSFSTSSQLLVNGSFVSFSWAEIVLSWISRAAFSTKRRKADVGCKMAGDPSLLAGIVRMHVLLEKFWTDEFRYRGSRLTQIRFSNVAKWLMISHVTPIPLNALGFSLAGAPNAKTQQCLVIDMENTDEHVDRPDQIQKKKEQAKQTQKQIPKAAFLIQENSLSSLPQTYFHLPINAPLHLAEADELVLPGGTCFRFLFDISQYPSLTYSSNSHFFPGSGKNKAVVQSPINNISSRNEARGAYIWISI